LQLLTQIVGHIPFSVYLLLARSNFRTKPVQLHALLLDLVLQKLLRSRRVCFFLWSLGVFEGFSSLPLCGQLFSQKQEFRISCLLCLQLLTQIVGHIPFSVYLLLARSNFRTKPVQLHALLLHLVLKQLLCSRCCLHRRRPEIGQSSGAQLLESLGLHSLPVDVQWGRSGLRPCNFMGRLQLLLENAATLPACRAQALR